MTRTPPCDLKSLLIADEGLVQHVYPDSKDIPSIGVGRRVDEKGGLSMDEVLYLLSNDIAAVKADCALKYPWLAATDTPRQAVVYSMRFIFGAAGLAGWTIFLDQVRYGYWEAAAHNLETSKWATQAPERVSRFAKTLRTGAFV